jgi:two-component system CheB/CheR fusion protein
MAKKKNTTPTDKNFPIVGIGGSAGAIEAVMEIVENLSSHTGMAFIYLQHQSPDFESKMVDVLSKKSRVPVLQVEDGMPIEPDFFTSFRRVKKQPYRMVLSSFQKEETTIT